MFITTSRKLSSSLHSNLLFLNQVFKFSVSFQNIILRLQSLTSFLHLSPIPSKTFKIIKPIFDHFDSTTKVWKLSTDVVLTQLISGISRVSKLLDPDAGQHHSSSNSDDSDMSLEHSYSPSTSHSTHSDDESSDSDDTILHGNITLITQHKHIDHELWYLCVIDGEDEPIWINSDMVEQYDQHHIDNYREQP